MYCFLVMRRIAQTHVSLAGLECNDVIHILGLEAMGGRATLDCEDVGPTSASSDLRR